MKQKPTTKIQNKLCILSPSPIVFYCVILQKKNKMESNTKNSMHIRCNSLPSAPHPLVPQFHENLQRLKDSEATSTSSISHKLSGLMDLHDCADKLLQLSTTQQTLTLECGEKSVDDLLEGSLRLLDICSTAQDCLLRSKENMHVVQSVIRRKSVAGVEFTVEGEKYLTSRKMIKKEIQKVLRNLKGMKNELIACSSSKDNENSSIFVMLKEAEAVTVRSLESMLLFVSDSKGQSKKSIWSTMSKMMQPTRVTCDFSQESDSNEFVKVDATLQSLISHKVLSVENIHSHMENLEICIEDLEGGVEQLSRQLIRTRVSLLNIFSQ